MIGSSLIDLTLCEQRAREDGHVVREASQGRRLGGAAQRSHVGQRDDRESPGATRETGSPLVVPLKVKLGRAVRRLRSAAGFSQESFADACSAHRTFIGVIERGEANVSLTTIERLAHGLGITVSALLADAEAGGEGE